LSDDTDTAGRSKEDTKKSFIELKTAAPAMQLNATEENIKNIIVKSK
jgi:hypothetical protein